MAIWHWREESPELPFFTYSPGAVQKVLFLLGILPPPKFHPRFPPPSLLRSWPFLSLFCKPFLFYLYVAKIEEEAVSLKRSELPGRTPPQARLDIFLPLFWLREVDRLRSRAVLAALFTLL